MGFIKNITIMLSLLLMSSVAFASDEEAEGEAAAENGSCITFEQAKHYEEVKAAHEREEADKEHADESDDAEHASEHHEKYLEHEHEAEKHDAEAADLDSEHAPENSTACVDASGNAGFIPAVVSSVTGSSAYREVRGK